MLYFFQQVQLLLGILLHTQYKVMLLSRYLISDIEGLSTDQINWLVLILRIFKNIK